MGKILNVFNGGMAAVLRVAILIMIPIVLFFGNQLSQDIRTKFDEITYDIRLLRVSIVGKEVYHRDMDRIDHRISQIEKRTYKIRGG